MKKQWIMAGAVLLLAGSCAKEADIHEMKPEGAAIAFNASTTYGNRVPETRTTYSGEVFSDGYRTVERIDWVEGDLVTIACAESPEGQADYQIGGGGNGTSTMMLKPFQTEGGLSWGTGEHRFLAMYPAAATEGVGTGNASVEGNAFRARIPDIQTVTKDGETFFTDMRLAYMWAATKASRNGSTPVKLSFRPMMTAFEFTLSALDPYPLVLNSLTLLSEASPLAGAFTATVSEDMKELEYFVDLPSKEIQVNLGGAVVDQEQTITFTVFCLPTDITKLHLILDTGDGIRNLDFIKDGQWLTFAGGLKLRIRNLPIETQDLLFEGTAEGPFTVKSVNVDCTTTYEEITVTPDADGSFSARIPRLTDRASHYWIDGGDNLLTITRFPPVISTDNSLWGLFMNSRSLTSFVSFSTEEIRRFSYMFSDCRSLVEGPGMDTSKGTNFRSMFSGCSQLTSVPLYDTSKGVYFMNMFQNCKALTAIPFLETGRGQNFSGMFYGCSALTEVPALNTAKGTQFTNMFYNCRSLSQVPDRLETSLGTSFYGMFMNCESLPALPEMDTSNGSSFAYAFYNCRLITACPAYDLSSGKSFKCMFHNCVALESIPSFDTRNGTNFSYMFSHCYALTSIPGFDTSNGKDFRYMFNGDKMLSSLGRLDCSAVTEDQNLDNFLNQCRALATTEGFGAVRVNLNIMHPSLSRNQIMVIADQLATVDGKQLTVNPTQYARLTASDIASIEAKGWSVVIYDGPDDSTEEEEP